LNSQLDEEYLSLVKNILNNEEFLKLKVCEHHGITRFEHSLKVSYGAYKYAKKHNLDYKEVAVGGLLHDFFQDENNNIKDKFISTFTHPNKAVKNAIDKFYVNDKEADIIKSHMFPLNISIPKYKESWLVSLYDKKYAIIEFASKFNHKFRYATNFLLLMVFNFIK